MADNWYISPILIHKITLFVYYNYYLKRLDAKLNEPTNQNSTKVPKVVKSKKNNIIKKLLENSVM